MPRRRSTLSRSRDGQRVDLREVSLLTAQTKSLHGRAISALETWLATLGIQIVFDLLLDCPLVLDRIIEAFGAASYSTGAPMYSYLMALTGIQALRRSCGGAFRLLGRSPRFGTR